jgi:metal-responsive CopG/Arc/MetJ family transcriptional regulator
MDELQLEKLDKFAKEHGCYRSEVIRFAIDFLLKILLELQENGTLSKAEIEKLKSFRCNELGQG